MEYIQKFQILQNSRDSLVKRLSLADGAFPNAVTKNEPFLLPLFHATSPYISHRTDHDDRCDESDAAANWIPGERSLNDILRLSFFRNPRRGRQVDLDRAALRRLTPPFIITYLPY